MPHTIRLALAAIALQVFSCHAWGSELATPTQLLFYRHLPVCGGCNPYSLVEVGISTEGAVLMVRQTWDKEPVHTSFTLNKAELKSLQTMIRKTGFPALPRGRAVDVGGVLRLSLDGSTREVMIRPAPARLKPIVYYASSFLQQARLLDEVRINGNTYEALGALDPSLCAARVVQPQVLREPLEAFAKTSEDASKLGYAVDALRWLMPPGEWADFLATVWAGAEEDRRVILIRTITPQAMVNRTIPSEYKSALAGLYATMLADGAAMNLSPTDAWFLDSVKPFAR